MEQIGNWYIEKKLIFKNKNRPTSNSYVGYPYHPLVRYIGPLVSECDHHLQKELEAANVDLGLASSQACLHHLNK